MSLWVIRFAASFAASMDLSSPPPRPRRSRRLSIVGGRIEAHLPPPQARPTTRRLLIVGIMLGVSGFLLALNLFRLQILQGAELLKQAREQQTTYLRPFVPRRPIVDRVGNILAIDRPIFTLFAHPKLFNPQSKEEMAKILGGILGRDQAGLVKLFDSAESGIRVEYTLTEDTADRIRRLQLNGLELIQYQQRLYPQENLTADIVGYVDSDHRGQAGIELSQHNLLERSVKAVRLSRTATGALMPDRVPGGFLHLDDLQLQLTLDSRLQRVALASLKEQVKKYNAKRGVVLVMDVRDGALLTLVSEPSYNPNQYYKEDVARFKNWALTDLYEPGSTFKPVNVAIALETGAIKPDSVFNDEGMIYVAGWPIENFDFSSRGGRGALSITEILQHSSNVGMVHIIQQLKPAVYYNWLERLGLNQKTGIDLPSEVASQLKDHKIFLESAIEPATAAFGQGFSLTPVELIRLHGAIANGGRLVTPHVVKGLYDSKNQPYWQPNPSAPKQVFSLRTSQTVLAMMENVVNKGTGKNARVEGYRVAGKTGTAQKANPNGGYYDRAKITSFIGIFPVDNPRYAVLAVIDEPKGEDAFGSTVAAPIVKNLLEALVTLEKIPPSAPLPKASPTPNP